MSEEGKKLTGEQAVKLARVLTVLGNGNYTARASKEITEITRHKPMTFEYGGVDFAEKFLPELHFAVEVAEQAIAEAKELLSELVDGDLNGGEDS